MKRNIRLLLFILIALTAIAGAIFLDMRYKTNQPPDLKVFASDECDETLWEHVWKPGRLVRIADCISVTGVIVAKKPDDDGDIHYRLRLDKEYNVLLNDYNIRLQDSCLVVEVICYYPPQKPAAIRSCQGYENDVNTPEVGKRVKVTGTFVSDSNNGWNEIHPASSIRVLEDFFF
ncbi:MAG: hypothetical protein DWQ44_04520 [Bacteroidetes bacterium]|nr:MAG: hypothetical protein DWQ33_11270 [Bacteroidota bacterium]REK00665.1 MAG: hypothetical protein DWQ39_10945 [Bacteroidota bacterium]REK35213.1 MAG: hypothetical protein DWQ44_04520 [Bacteroidota bacterium]REK48290.1 MAG: hypothetical protein DWQ48_10720 [Bacteroidota bacterium]